MHNLYSWQSVSISRIVSCHHSTKILFQCTRAVLAILSPYSFMNNVTWLSRNDIKAYRMRKGKGGGGIKAYRMRKGKGGGDKSI